MSSIQTRPTLAKAPRVPACIACQQRKVKCDRNFPCANCRRTGMQCVSANAVGHRPRRRRFPERELLARLRQYEDLLRENDVDFELLHSKPPTTIFSESTSKTPQTKPIKAIDVRRALSKLTLEPEDDDEIEEDKNFQDDGTSALDNNPPEVQQNATFKSVWGSRYQAHGKDQVDSRTHDYLLFGACDSDMDLLSLHPEHIQIFKLWQTYVNNVDPLLKVTHCPTLQQRIIDAASDLSNANPALEALMFSIYCISIVSLTEDDCYNLFRSPKLDLLARYHSGCRHALAKCSPWRSTGIDGLIALYIYLVSIRPQSDPLSLSCMLASAVQIARRLGLHMESTYLGFSAFEAEMRRRLWWSLVVFDHRISEMSDYTSTMLIPTWDCKVPSNLNDFEIRRGMTYLPTMNEKPTEALFAVVRNELADVLRNSTYHLHLANPILTTIVESNRTSHNANKDGTQLADLEKNVEDRYFRFCNIEDPLHYMTIWTTRATLARSSLLEYYSKHSSSSTRPTNAQRSAAFSHALRMLGCDTKLRTSPLTRGYIWFVNFYFPALAYLHILNCLWKRPNEDNADEAWSVMARNYEALITFPKQHQGDGRGGIEQFFMAFTHVVTQAWDARKAMLQQQNKVPEEPPRIVADVINNMEQARLLNLSPILESSKGEQSTINVRDSGYDDHHTIFTAHTDVVNYHAGPTDGQSSSVQFSNMPGHSINRHGTRSALDRDRLEMAEHVGLKTLVANG